MIIPNNSLGYGINYHVDYQEMHPSPIHQIKVKIFATGKERFSQSQIRTKKLTEKSNTFKKFSNGKIGQMFIQSKTNDFRINLILK